MSRTATLSSTPIQAPAQTVPWYRRASVWFGIGINPASISVGGGLAQRIPASELLWLIPLGALVLVCMSTAQGLIGLRRRERLAQIATSTVGAGGAGLINLLMAIGMIGWGGFHGGVSGASAAQLFHLPGWAGALFVAVALFVLAELGVNRWATILWLTTVSAVALTLFALWAVDLNAPAAIDSSPGSVSAWLWGLGAITAYATLFSLRGPDFTWDMASAADVIKVNVCFYFLLVFSTGAGVLLYHATGQWNIADILTQVQSAGLGHLFLLIAVASPLLSGLYSGALALSGVSPLSLRQSTALICALTFALATTRFDQRLITFLGLIGASLGPALFVILLANALKPKPAWRLALMAWLFGAIVALIFQWQGQSIHIFAGALTSMVVLGLLHVSTAQLYR
ncbi:MAG: hypothetical protein R3A44_13565 [Caldilineaceae bacterium]